MAAAMSSKMPLIVTKMYDYLLYLIPQVSKFPRAQRFQIGERLENLSYDVLELLLDATYSRNKAPILYQANVKLAKARYFVRLCKDLKLINLKKYEILTKQINEIGIQLGGWIKQQKNRS